MIFERGLACIHHASDSAHIPHDEVFEALLLTRGAAGIGVGRRQGSKSFSHSIDSVTNTHILGITDGQE